MRIAISLLNFRPGKIGGAETYIRQLIKALARIRGQEELYLVAFRDNADAIRAEGVETVVVNKSDRDIIAARCLEAFTPYRARFAEKVFDELRPDVVLFPQQSTFPKHVRCASVLSVMDLQHLILPGHLSLFERAFRRAIYPCSLRRAQSVIAISRYTKQCLEREYRLSRDQVVAIPLGFEPAERQADAPYHAPAGEYVYYPAASFPHKNHHQLFETIAKLRRRGEFDYQLVLSGAKTPFWRKLCRSISRLGIEDAVVHLGHVSFDQVCSLYRGAAAVLFPSQFEGFGLPVLEGVSFGKKVIVSRLEVFRELGVPDRFQIDFSEPDQLLRALHEPGPTILTNEPSTWHQCAAATLDALRSAARGHR